MRYCVFCRIIEGSEPARIIVDEKRFLVFRNVLGWLPVMLLAVPKDHLEQEQLWRDVGMVSATAAALGREHCPHGFRLVSNFGWDALQSQPHAHIHVLGGSSMEAVTGRLGETEPMLETAAFTVTRRRSGWPPVTLVAEPRRPMTQDELWANTGLMTEIGTALVGLGKELCPYGFRFVSDFGWDALQAQQQAHIYLLGGTDLGHYV